MISQVFMHLKRCLLQRGWCNEGWLLNSCSRLICLYITLLHYIHTNTCWGEGMLDFNRAYCMCHGACNFVNASSTICIAAGYFLISL